MNLPKRKAEVEVNNIVFGLNEISLTDDSDDEEELLFLMTIMKMKSKKLIMRTKF